MDEQLKAAITAIGALAEMSHLFYTDLLSQGFTQQQALELTKVFVASSIQSGSSRE